MQVRCVAECPCTGVALNSERRRREAAAQAAVRGPTVTVISAFAAGWRALSKRGLTPLWIENDNSSEKKARDLVLKNPLQLILSWFPKRIIAKAS